MSKKSKNDRKISAYKPDEKGNLSGTAISFGIINLALVGLCYLIKLAIISSGLLLFFLLGFYASFVEVKDAISERELKPILKALAGLAINIVAAIIYLMIMKARYS